MDIALIESGNGGDLLLRGRDLLVYKGFENMIYLALFGGNVEANTGFRAEGEQAFDWWGNKLFFAEKEGFYFNSDTERALQQVALNSAGRLFIERNVINDLAFLQQYAEVKVETRIISDDRLQIEIFLKELAGNNQRRVVFIFDPATGDIVIPPRSGDYSPADYNQNDYNT